MHTSATYYYPARCRTLPHVAAGHTTRLYCKGEGSGVGAGAQTEGAAARNRLARGAGNGGGCIGFYGF